MSKVSDPVITQSMLDKALEKNNKVLTRNIVDEISGIIDVFVTKMDNRFNKIEKEIVDLKASHDRLLNTIDGFIKRIDDYEQENIARDRQLKRMDAWIHQIAKETGVKLKELI